MVMSLNRTGAAFRNARAVKACTPSNMIIAGSIATFSCFQVMVFPLICPFKIVKRIMLVVQQGLEWLSSPLVVPPSFLLMQRRLEKPV